MAILNHPATGAKNMQPDPAVVEAAVLFSLMLIFFYRKDEPTVE